MLNVVYIITVHPGFILIRPIPFHSLRTDYAGRTGTVLIPACCACPALPADRTGSDPAVRLLSVGQGVIILGYIRCPLGIRVIIDHLSNSAEAYQLNVFIRRIHDLARHQGSRCPVVNRRTYIGL